MIQKMTLQEGCDSMKKLISAWLLCALLAALLMPGAAASLDSDTITSRDEMDGILLLADYPADEFSSSFTGNSGGNYTEIYSYEDVGVMVHNLRHTLFSKEFDEIIFLNNNFGEIQNVKWVDIDPIGDAYLTVRMRFEIKSNKEDGPEEWIADVVKVYYLDNYYMFVVARDANGKNYAKKVDALIESLRLSEAGEVPSDRNDSAESFFAPRDAD